MEFSTKDTYAVDLKKARGGQPFMEQGQGVLFLTNTKNDGLIVGTRFQISIVVALRTYRSLVKWPTIYRRNTAYLNSDCCFKNEKTKLRNPCT